MVHHSVSWILLALKFIDVDVVHVLVVPSVVLHTMSAC